MRGEELPQTAKFLNKIISSVPIVVANVISGGKRCLDCERRVEIDERVSFGCGDGDCLWSAQSENYISTTNENQ